MARESATVHCAIGGWLALLWFSLTIGAPLSLILDSVGTMTINQKPNSLITFNENPYAIILGIAYLAMAVFSFTSGIKLRHTARPARVYLIAQIVFGSALATAFALLRDPAAAGRLAAGTVVSAAWIIYLDRSARVRNTYTTEFMPNSVRQPLSS